MRVALEVFAERSGTGTRRDEEALVRDAYMKFHDGRRLDVREDARDALLIEMPIAPGRRHRNGRTSASPTSQAAEAASPATNEQLRLQKSLISQTGT